MFRQISTYIFLVLIAGLNGYPKLAKKIKIIEGQSTEIKSYPFQVAILFSQKYHKCGGSLIDHSAVLTAAHCVYKNRDTIEYFSIVAGSSYINQGGHIREVDEIHVHEGFNNITLDFDVAILKLKSPLTLGPTIRPVKLPDKDFVIKRGTKGIATGWGRTLQSIPNSKHKSKAYHLQLQKVSLPILSDEECKNYYPKWFSSRMMCAGYKFSAKDTCKGDSGGPLVVEGIQVGIVSWGESCRIPKYPGVYTKVASVLEFIDTYVKK